MTPRRRLPKADQTRARLIAVTKRLFQEQGADRVTLRDIAAAARMEAGSIYYHFDSRDEILRAVLESGVGGARAAVMEAIAATGTGSDPVVRLRAALGAHLKYTLREHFSSRLTSIRLLPKQLRDRHLKQEREYAAIFAGLLREAQKTGRMHFGFNLSAARMLAMGALTWVAEWYDPKGPMTPDDIADELMHMLTGSVFKDQSQRSTRSRASTSKR